MEHAEYQELLALAAVDALEQVARESENIGLYVALGRAGGASTPLAEAIIAAFDKRKNQLATDVGMEGQARGYFPHTAAEDNPKQGFSGATRRPAVGDTLGIPKKMSVSLPGAS